MRFRKLLLTLAPVALLLGLSNVASAGVLADGSISFAGLVDSYNGANLASAVSITLNTQDGVVTSRAGDFIGLTPLLSSTLTSPITFTVPLSVYPLFIQWGDGTDPLRFSFTVTASVSSSITADDLTIYASGIFSDSTGFYDNNDASLIMNLTQAGGSGNAISLSGTIATPPAFELAPEPASLALMGSALVAVGLFGRKKLFRR